MRTSGPNLSLNLKTMANLTSDIPHYTQVLDNAKADLDAIRATPKGLAQDDFLAYLQLKLLVPFAQRQDLRDAFLKFQDRDMMDKFREDYL